MTDMSWEHAAEARQALNAIVGDPQHGVAALSSAQTMSNLLKDLLPDAPREKSILVAAAEAGVADTLRQHVGQGMDPDTAIRLTASSFSATTPFTTEACTWVAGEIASALGMRHSGGAGGARSGFAGTPAGFDTPGQAAPTQVAPIPGYTPGQQPTQGSPQAPGPGGYGAGAARTTPGPWQAGQAQPGQPGGGYGQAQPAQPAQPGQPGGAYGQAPAQPGGAYGQAQPAQPGQPGGAYGQAAQPAQPGGAYRQPGQPGQPGAFGQGQPAAGGWQGQPQQAGYGQAQPGAGFGQAGVVQPGGWQQGAQGQPGYSPGGYQPAAPTGPMGPIFPGGPGGPVRQRGRGRGLAVAGGIVGVGVVAIIIAVSLSGGHNPKPTPTPRPTSPVTSPVSPTPTPSPTNPPGTEPLLTIMNPPDGTHVGKSCGAANLFGLKASTVVASTYCKHTTHAHIVVWGYQFDSSADYQRGLTHINQYVAFSGFKPGNSCPPSGSSIEGKVAWNAKYNPKYFRHPGQDLECLRYEKAPLLIWTFPTQDAFLIGEDRVANSSFDTVLNWWKTLTYG